MPEDSVPTLVLSYPERGMLPSATKMIPVLIHQYFGRPPLVHSVAASHSSFGASQKADRTTPFRKRNLRGTLT